MSDHQPASPALAEAASEILAYRETAKEASRVHVEMHNELVSLRAEVEALKKPPTTNVLYQHELDRMLKISEAKVAELEAALERYGMHLRSCEMLPQDPDRNDPHCTCGLNKALRGEANHD